MGELKPKLTKSSASEVTRVFISEAEKINLKPTIKLITTIVAQSALETGHWQYMYNYNFGNVKATDKWIANGGSFTFYNKKPPHAPAPVSENLSKAAANYWMKQAKPRTDGGEDLDMVISHKRTDGKYVCYFWPSHVQTRFRAFETLEDGAKQFLKKLTGKFKESLKYAKTGDITGYISVLSSLNYFTAPMHDRIVNGRKKPGYLSSVKYLYNLYLPLVKNIMTKEKLQSDLPDDDVFRTKLEHIEVHKNGWITLSTGVKVTRLPLMDSSIPGRVARIGFGTAEKWLKPRGYRLLTAAEYEELNKLSIYIAPYCMPTIEQCKAAGIPLIEEVIDKYRTDHMMSSAWCDIHDKHVWKVLEKLNWDGIAPVVNFGKHWCLPTGCIYGWWYKNGKRIQNLSRFHAGEPEFCDYATNVFAACDPDIAHKDTDPAPDDSKDNLDPDLSHAERIVKWLESKVGIKEDPFGSNKGKEVCAWLKPCKRKGYGKEFGEYLASVGANWCMSFASASHEETRLSTDPPRMFEYRCSGIEAENDSKASGAWRDASLARSGAYTPRAGDVAIYKSGSQAWRRHVVVVVEMDAERSYRGIAGNEKKQVQDVSGRSIDDTSLLGFIELPRVEKEENPDWSPFERAIELEKNLYEDAVGMDEFDKLLLEMEEVDPKDDGE